MLIFGKKKVSIFSKKDESFMINVLKTDQDKDNCNRLVIRITTLSDKDALSFNYFNHKVILTCHTFNPETKHHISYRFFLHISHYLHRLILSNTSNLHVEKKKYCWKIKGFIIYIYT